MSNNINRHLPIRYSVFRPVTFVIGDLVCVVNDDDELVWRKDNIHEALEYGRIISFWSKESDSVIMAEIDFGDIKGSWPVRNLKHM